MKKEKTAFPENLDEETTNVEEKPRTRIVGMKWVKLGEGKDPEFKTDLFVCQLDAQGHVIDYGCGQLKGIEIESNRKIFKFILAGHDPTIPDSSFTHYAIPTIPI